ncbi:MAG TPA: PrsW family glutamic-type intramembrane protease [Anaerolineales bacterium]|nr:PrsW family glutamic-type intramembrane protease [Anaerolineales bacterium]
MQTKKIHWASLVILLILATSITFLLLIVLSLGVASLVDLFSSSAEAASEMIGAVAFGFISILLLISGWFILQKTRGLEQADQNFKFPFAPWMWLVLPALVIFSILFGGLITFAEIPWLNWLLLPFLTVLVIVPPIWLLFGIASNGLNLGPLWRFFSILGLGMTAGPIIMIVLEMVLLLTLIIAGVAYIAITRPEMVSEIESLANMLNQGLSEDAMLNLLSPYLTNPTLLAIGIGYIALLVPLIEELFKPLAVWLFARQLESPAQGFALGVLSGAAFALVESLNASADGTTSWAVIVAARTGTSVLHMLTTGLVGWGIAMAFKEKRYGRLFGAYLSAVLIHGIWNAAAAGTGISALGESVGKPEWLFNYAPALVCGLLVLGMGTTSLLVASNRKLRKQLELAHVVDSSAESAKVQEIPETPSE